VIDAPALAGGIRITPASANRPAAIAASKHFTLHIAAGVPRCLLSRACSGGAPMSPRLTSASAKPRFHGNSRRIALHHMALRGGTFDCLNRRPQCQRVGNRRCFRPRCPRYIANTSSRAHISPRHQKPKSVHSSAYPLSPNEISPHRPARNAVGSSRAKVSYQQAQHPLTRFSCSLIEDEGVR
jgi:hypothetical protein